jgi:DNA repair exonuclease SbcCD nuclease subunit
MKIAICSDVHLEFGQLVLENTDEADVLILSGDICVARDFMDRDPYDIMDYGKSARYHEFFSSACDKFRNVVYIVGNHEHYHGDFVETIPNLRKRLAYLKNLHILDKETVELGDVTFIGGTLWTDMNKEDPMTLYGIRRMMNDFRCVTNSNREVNYKSFDDVDNPDKPTFRTRTAIFSPEDAVEDHKKMLDFIKTVVAEKHDKKFVVVGHHTPSQASCHAKYADDQLMNGGYHSDLSEFIMDRPQIKLWTHGHTHELFDYMIGETRVVCNPRGYIGYEEISDNFKLKVVEV